MAVYLANACTLRDAASDPRVAGGIEVSDGETIARSSVALYLWFSRFDKELRYQCGATLISPTAVVTAAHCLGADAHGGYHVVLGVSPKKATLSVETFFNEEAIIPVAEDGMVIHPSYDQDVYDSPDLAILRLKRPVPAAFRAVAVTPAGTNLTERATLTVASYGPTIRDGEDSGILRRLNLPYIGKDPKSPSGTKLIMQGVPGTPGSTACPGDSGGSVYFEFDGYLTLLGVLTGGRHGCLTRDVGDNLNIAHDLRAEWEWLKKEVTDLPTPQR